MKPAKNRGTCQWCGRVQNLPLLSGGVGDRPVLAKHGYQVKFRGDGGFFSGTCPGSGHAPFEKSKDLIDESIELARSEIRRLYAVVEKLERIEPTATNKAWIHVYHPSLSTRTRGAVYLWEECELQADGPWSFCALKDGRKHVIHSRIEEAVRDGIEGYSSHLRGRMKELGEYIKTQQRRAAEWKPDQPLLPLA